MEETQEQVINKLNANWIWTQGWVDSSLDNTAGLVVTFTREVRLQSSPIQALLHFSADTRYKLIINGARVAVGPVRSSPLIWYYDTLDIAPHLRQGHNVIQFLVIRYFAATRAAMPFERTLYPGLTVCGNVHSEDETIDISSSDEWRAEVDEGRLFPIGLIDDGFLHISERIRSPRAYTSPNVVLYNFNTKNGDLLPWRLRPRSIPMPEQTPAPINTVRACHSNVVKENWVALLQGKQRLRLPAESSHVVDLQADVHSTAFLAWRFLATEDSQVRLKVTYSEGYELQPRSYPFFRSKEDRLDVENGHILGPFDDVTLLLEGGKIEEYEPFWFRTFRVLRVEITTGPKAVDILSLDTTQVNYPLNVSADWKEPCDSHSEMIWDVSIRTLRNCMFDGYSDCPFYEQLQYSGDSRSVGLFHYLLSGDDRLMRQTITNFAASVTPEGLTQSRFPSHVNQLIAAFPLYWILMVCDHHLFFGDARFSRSFLPRIDGVLEFFQTYVDNRGLVSGLPEDVWQFVDWVTSWGATEDFPDKGVPTAGRRTNTYTYFSMLYAYVLEQAATLVHSVGRPAHAEEYRSRAYSLRIAIREHCYDGEFFTDSSSDVADRQSYSQHCQVWAVLSEAAELHERPRLLKESMTNPEFSKCSYMMMFYAFRAFAKAGDDIYHHFWTHALDPWRRMLGCNLTTWEEDDVRQRSDCHAWGSVPIYEYCIELAGIHPIASGCSKILFKPRVRLSENLQAKVALGKDNLATVCWSKNGTGRVQVELKLLRPIEVASKLPGQGRVEHGVTDRLATVCDA